MIFAPSLRSISRRRRSSSAWIFNRDHSSCFVSSTICSASERGGEEGDGLTIGSTVTIADREKNENTIVRILLRYFLYGASPPIGPSRGDIGATVNGYREATATHLCR